MVAQTLTNTCRAPIWCNRFAMMAQFIIIANRMRRKRYLLKTSLCVLEALQYKPWNKLAHSYYHIRCINRIEASASSAIAGSINHFGLCYQTDDGFFHEDEFVLAMLKTTPIAWKSISFYPAVHKKSQMTPINLQTRSVDILSDYSIQLLPMEPRQRIVGIITVRGTTADKIMSWRLLKTLGTSIAERTSKYYILYVM